MPHEIGNVELLYVDVNFTIVDVFHVQCSSNRNTELRMRWEVKCERWNEIDSFPKTVEYAHEFQHRFCYLQRNYRLRKPHFNSSHSWSVQLVTENCIKMYLILKLRVSDATVELEVKFNWRTNFCWLMESNHANWELFSLGGGKINPGVTQSSTRKIRNCSGHANHYAIHCSAYLLHIYVSRQFSIFFPNFLIKFDSFVSQCDWQSMPNRQKKQKKLESTQWQWCDVWNVASTFTVSISLCL